MKKKRILRKVISITLITGFMINLNAFKVFAQNEGTEVVPYGTQTAVEIYEQRNFRTPTGHGWAAERANNLEDRIKGKNAEVVGGNNAKNGADRRVLSADGEIINIQSKYYSSATDTVNAAFDKETGMYRYMNSDNTPMKLEVPADQYEEAVKKMEVKIEEGKVPGVTDINEASNYVQKGNVTYEQAKNITKAGKFDSIKFDVKTGVITTTLAFGISFAFDYVISRMNGQSNQEALKDATLNSLKVGGIVMGTHVIACQLAKTKLASAYTPGSEALANLLGDDIAKSILKTTGMEVEGLTKQQLINKVSKVIRSNLIVDTVVFVTLSAGDIYDAINGRISVEQLIANMTVTASTIGAAGLGAWAGGAIAGVPGAIFGGAAGALLADKTVTYIIDSFTESDAEEMHKVLNKKAAELANDYLVSQEEFDSICQNLQEVLDQDMTKDMYQSDDREQFADDLMRPYFEEAIANRAKITAPDADQLRYDLKTEFKGIIYIH